MKNRHAAATQVPKNAQVTMVFRVSTSRSPTTAKAVIAITKPKGTNKTNAKITGLPSEATASKPSIDELERNTPIKGKAHHFASN